MLKTILGGVVAVALMLGCSAVLALTLVGLTSAGRALWEDPTFGHAFPAGLCAVAFAWWLALPLVATFRRSE
ncbi:hypothetical protein ACFWDN_21125 [Micromonospora chalcea]